MEYDAHNICEIHDDSGKDSMKSETQDECEVQNDDSGTDRISELPDDSLQHILSYLPAKEIVRTCALSTRWRSIWTWYTIPTSDFVLLSVLELNRFLDPVKGELIIPDNARPRRFQILYRHCGFYRYQGILLTMQLVSKAMKHQFEELDLTFEYLESNLHLPHTLFTCQSLTSLKLYMNRVQVINTNLPSISLHRLRTLHLSYIKFMYNCFPEQLISGCLVLEDLRLYQCSWEKTSDITIAVPSLQRLSIYLNENLSKYPLIIHCPNLKFFEFSSRCWDFNLVLDLPSLVKAYINIWNTGICQNYIHFPPNHQKQYRIKLARTLELFERIRGVESLRLSSDTFQTICYVEDVVADELPTFHNLTRLKLLGKHNEYVNPITATALLHILHKSPKLQSIAFADIFNLLGDLKGDLLEDSVPVCLIHSVKRFRFSRFSGDDGEVLLLKYTLKNASVLKSFSVHCGEELSENQERKEKIRLELKQLCKEHCEFSFI